jgi:outer membrane biosynthesis protein TonB
LLLLAERGGLQTDDLLWKPGFTSWKSVHAVCVPRQPENIRESKAGYASNSPTGELNVALKSAVLPMSEGNAREGTETDPTEPMRDTLEGNATTSTRISLETVPGSKAQKPASRSTKKPNGSAYGAGVYAALGRHKPSAVERGSATVTFSIDADGELSNVRIGQSSSNGATRSEGAPVGS